MSRMFTGLAMSIQLRTIQPLTSTVLLLKQILCRRIATMTANSKKKKHRHEVLLVIPHISIDFLFRQKNEKKKIDSKENRRRQIKLNLEIFVHISRLVFIARCDYFCILLFSIVFICFPQKKNGARIRSWDIYNWTVSILVLLFVHFLLFILIWSNRNWPTTPFSSQTKANRNVRRSVSKHKSWMIAFGVSCITKGNKKYSPKISFILLFFTSKQECGTIEKQLLQS